MPPANHEVPGWSAQTLTEQTGALVPRCATLVERLLAHRRHPQQTYRICMGVRTLGQKYGIGCPEAALTSEIKHSVVSAKGAQAISKNRINLQ
ncbi:Mobile element protein [Janthinobacterium sp. CG23_2]|nr:Mobile element protein [Janthinobacterium sp. CG23_2]CUU27993.1 Mobile element protein [Janthinobacterium sp. CG23_2]